MQPASDVMRVQLILQGAGKYRLHKLTGRNCCVDAVFVIYLFIIPFISLLVSSL